MLENIFICINIILKTEANIFIQIRQNKTGQNFQMNEALWAKYSNNSYYYSFRWRLAFVVYPNTCKNEADEVLLCCISSSQRHMIKYRNHGNI